MDVISSWSGGKDSCFALMMAVESGHQLKYLLNMMNENGEISRSHGIPATLLNQQSNRLGMSIKTVPATWEQYEEYYIQALVEIKTEVNVQAVVFGDIDLESHKEWEQKVCASASLEALLPLWKGDRKDLVCQMIDAGIRAVITSCNTKLGFGFLGKEITHELVEELERKGVDVCGENGEYHTLVFNCPLFSKALELPSYEKVQHGEYCFLDWSKD